MRYDAERQLETLIRAVLPEPVQCRAMLADMSSLLSEQRLLYLLQCSRSTFTRWQSGEIEPSSFARRAIWLLWQSICRPGAVQTVFDVITFGAYTTHGGCEHAGKPPLRPMPSKLDAGQYPLRDPHKGDYKRKRKKPSSKISKPLKDNT